MLHQESCNKNRSATFHNLLSLYKMESEPINVIVDAAPLKKKRVVKKKEIVPCIDACDALSEQMAKSLHIGAETTPVKEEEKKKRVGVVKKRVVKDEATVIKEELVVKDEATVVVKEELVIKDDAIAASKKEATVVVKEEKKKRAPKKKATASKADEPAIVAPLEGNVQSPQLMEYMTGGVPNSKEVTTIVQSFFIENHLYVGLEHVDSYVHPVFFKALSSVWENNLLPIQFFKHVKTEIEDGLFHVVPQWDQPTCIGSLTHLAIFNCMPFEETREYRYTHETFVS